MNKGYVPSQFETDAGQLVRGIRDTHQYAVSGPDSAVVGNLAAFASDNGKSLSDVGVPLNHSGCGRLVRISSTQIAFQPFGGNLIKISGAWYAIPAAGVTANTTSVFVEGVAAQNLSASTLYYVYLFVNSGTLTIDFSTTAHSTSSTAGNIGTEVKTGDETRSLVGMIRTNASTQFQDDTVARYLLSWFNRQPKDFSATVANTSTTSTTPAEVSTSSTRGESLNWANSAVIVAMSATLFTGSAGQFGGLHIRLDGTVAISGTAFSACLSTSFSSGTPFGFATGAEGYHFYAAYAVSSVGTNTFSVQNGVINGVTFG